MESSSEKVQSSQDDMDVDVAPKDSLAATSGKADKQGDSAGSLEQGASEPMDTEPATEEAEQDKKRTAAEAFEQPVDTPNKKAATEGSEANGAPSSSSKRVPKKKAYFADEEYEAPKLTKEEQGLKNFIDQAFRKAYFDKHPEASEEASMHRATLS